MSSVNVSLPCASINMHLLVAIWWQLVEERNITSAWWGRDDLNHQSFIYGSVILTNSASCTPGSRSSIGRLVEFLAMWKHWKMASGNYMVLCRCDSCTFSWCEL